jgi:hypothetical protein
LLTSAWKEYFPDHLRERPNDKTPTALYIIANAGAGSPIVHYAIATDLFGTHAVQPSILLMDPEDENTWERWEPASFALVPSDGWIRHMFEQRISRHRVCLIKLVALPESQSTRSRRR